MVEEVEKRVMWLESTIAQEFVCVFFFGSVALFMR